MLSGDRDETQTPLCSFTATEERVRALLDSDARAQNAVFWLRAEHNSTSVF